MRNGINSGKHAKGFSVLLFTLVVLLAVSVASFISVGTVVTRQQSILSSFQQKTAFQTAQAGLDYSIPHLNNAYDTIEDGDTLVMNLSDGNYFQLAFSFVGSKDLIRVESTGYAGDGSGSHKIEHVVQYTSGAVNVTSTYALQTRGDLDMKNSSSISDLSGGAYTAKLGGDIELKNSASTILDSGVSSTRGNIGPDVVQNDGDIAASSNSELEMSFLGASFSEFQNEIPILALPAQSGSYDYNNDIAGLQGTSILITHTGGTANFHNHSTLGASADPVVLIVNLDSASEFVVGNNSNIYGKVVVNNGSVTIKNLVTIEGSLIVQGDLYLGNNTTVDGDVIITGNLLMDNSSQVNGAVFALGKIDMANSAIVNGAMLSGDEVTMQNSASVVYNPVNAAITVPGETGVAGYGKVSGSWTDISAP